MKNLILIGMPASGKSTLGRVLARRLGMEFLDTDDVLRQQLGESLQETIDREGLAAFLRREEAAILSVRKTNCVLATGGSVVYSKQAMAHLKADGLCIYLSVPFSSIQQRLDNLSTRGVALPEDKTLEDLNRERTPLYEQYCDVLFFEDAAHGDASVETHADALIFLLKQTGQVNL